MPATLFVRLAAAAGAAWPGYTRHDFVVRLARGDLPESAFRRYLVQDYLFLLHFARAWGLAVYKSDNLAEMRRAHALVAATLDVEIGLHVEYCRGWGLSEAAMAQQAEALETIAYTRFVLDRGLAGDRLDLEVALAPRIVGGAEGRFPALAASFATAARLEADFWQMGLNAAFGAGR